MDLFGAFFNLAVKYRGVDKMAEIWSYLQNGVLSVPECKTVSICKINCEGTYVCSLDCYCMESYCLSTLAVKHTSHLCAAFSTHFFESFEPL